MTPLLQPLRQVQALPSLDLMPSGSDKDAEKLLVVLDAAILERELSDLITAAQSKAGCLMAMCPSLDSVTPNWAADRIRPEDLAEDGIEHEPHVTVLYGFDLDFDPNRLARCGMKQPNVLLGKVSRFECEKYDVLKVDVNSPDLENLHKKLAGMFAGDIVPSKHTYHPHLTLAYVQKGACRELDGDTSFVGRDVYIPQLLYSLPDKQGRRVFDFVDKVAASTHYSPEQARYQAHVEAQAAAEAANRRAVHKALAAAEVATLEEKKDETGRRKLLLLLLLLIGAGSAAAYYAAYRRLTAHAGVTHAPTQHEVDQFVINRRRQLRPFVKRVVDELHLERARGMEQGETDDELAARLDLATHELEKSDGERVIQTEAQVAYGSAQLRVLQTAGFKTAIWTTMDDERVRESHRMCEEQGPVELGRPFHNGLRYPGDPNGPPEEVINCRCWLVGAQRHA